MLALPLLAPAAWMARAPDLAIETPWIGPVWAVGAATSLLPLLAGRLWLEAVAWRGSAVTGIVTTRPGDLAGPVTFGWWRPLILVPSDWASWSPEYRRAALAHEQAHVDRADWAVQTATGVVCAMFWFHPLAWLAWSKLRIAAEHATDDRVLLSGFKPSEYANALLRISQLRPARAGLSASRFAETRIRAVLSPAARSSSRRLVTMTLAFTLSLLLPPLGAMPLWAAPPPPHCLPLEGDSADNPPGEPRGWRFRVVALAQAMP